MKKILGKNIALILSFVLLVGTVVPMVTNIARATDENLTPDKAAVVSELKEAWDNLGKIGEKQFNIYRRYTNGTNTVDNDTVLIDTTPASADGINVGDKTTTVDISYSEAAAHDKGALFYEVSKQNGANIDFSIIEDMYFYFRVNSLASLGTLNIWVLDTGGKVSTTASASNYVSVTTEDINKWKKVSLSEVFGADWKTKMTELNLTGKKLARVNISVGGGFSGNVTFGSMFVVEPVTRPRRSIVKNI